MSSVTGGWLAMGDPADNTIDDSNSATLGHDGSELEWVKVTDLQPGDLVDFVGDVYADAGHGHHYHECPFEFEHRVISDPAGERETPYYFRLDYEGGACGFPPDHQVPRVKREKE